MEATGNGSLFRSYLFNIYFKKHSKKLHNFIREYKSRNEYFRQT